MCGRFTLTTPDIESLASLVSATIDPRLLAAYAPRYNIAPTQTTVLLRADAARRLEPGTWGLTSPWGDDRRPGGFINARSESAATLPSFRDAYARGRCLSMRSGLLFLGASSMAVLTGSAVGAAGLVFAGMVPASGYLEAAWRWALGDLYGVVAVLSSVLIGYRWHTWRLDGPLPFRYAPQGEKWLWLLVFLLSLVVVAWAAKRSGAYALGFASLPFVFVIWSAVRFEPPWTSFGTTVVGLYLATLIGLGYAGLAPPRDLGSTTILIAFLCMVSAAPQIGAAAAHENRVASVRALRRATVDRLTGLANRPAFEDRAKDAIRRHPQETMAMAYLDLDQFKLVNDTLSHGTGDELLRPCKTIFKCQ